MRYPQRTAAATTRRLLPSPLCTVISAALLMAAGADAKRLEEIPLIDVGDEITFHANESAAANFTLHYRTDNKTMYFGDCLELRFRVEGKRTRFNAYTCRMEEGGICSMYHFNHTFPTPASDDMRCLVMPAWMGKSSNYAFHFVFYRRLRRFRDQEEAERYRRRRHGRHGRREIGYVKLEGLRSCQEACESDACRPTKECRTLEAGRQIRARRSIRRI